jgi:hypothetical protein
MVANMVHTYRRTHHFDYWNIDGAWSLVRILKTS